MSDLLGMSIRGQRVLMVGVGGIGEPCAEMCAELGAALVLADRSAPDSVAQRITDEYQIKASAHAVDMGSVASVKQLWLQVSQLGDIDALIVTAAFLPAESDMEPGSTQWEESFQQVFQVNTRGPILISQLALKQMLKKKAGRIVILGSIAGRNGGLLSGVQYATSKGALHTLVRWLALRAAPHGVSVNGVAPGATATPILQDETVDIGKIPA